MSKALLIILVAINQLISCDNGKSSSDRSSSHIINMNQLITIIQDSSFQEFKNLVDRTGYELDSSIIDGKMLYLAEEPLETGNILSVQTVHKSYVDFLHLETHDEKLHKNLKDQLLEMEFKSLTNESGIEELEKDNVFITIISSTNERPYFYEIILVRKD